MRGYSKIHIRKPKGQEKDGLNITPIIVIIFIILLIIYIIITEGYLKK